MSDTEKNVAILLNGQEIEPDGRYDFSFRRVPSTKVPLYRGLASQLTVDPNDKNRLQAWYGDKLGHCEKTVLQSDFDEVKYLAAFKNISTDCVSKTLTDTNFTANPSEYETAILHIIGTVTVNIAQPKKIGTKLHLVVENLYKESTIKFAPELVIKWSGYEPVLPTDANKIYSITVTWTGSYWIAEQNISNGSVTNNQANLSACLNASVMSLGYCLPAGSSSVGEYDKKYALFSGIANMSDDDLINVAQVATNIGNINDLANIKEHINNVEDHMSEITQISNKMSVISTVATNITSINTVSTNKDKIDSIESNLPIISSVNTNLTPIKNVSNNLTAVNNVSKGMSAINNVSTNMQKIEDLLARYEALAEKDAASSTTTNSTDE